MTCCIRSTHGTEREVYEDAGRLLRCFFCWIDSGSRRARLDWPGCVQAENDVSSARDWMRGCEVEMSDEAVRNVREVIKEASLNTEVGPGFGDDLQIVLDRMEEAEKERDWLKRELSRDRNAYPGALEMITELRTERDALRARLEAEEKRLAEAERTIAWLRSGGGLFHYSRIDNPINYVEVGSHLESSPPEGWRP